ncbi:MAG TPA: hypothetical protein VKZ53_09090 [Candidatus Angelobacter sp.]|nr:hypothetical protein [Candidatus Angelobacter sp.]
MSRRKIFAIYIGGDFAILGGVLWCFFHRLTPRQYFFPAIAFFLLNGLWLIWMTIRHTPPGNP